MSEFLVMLVCLQGSGCSEASASYSFYNPEVMRQADVIKNKLPNFVILSAPYVGAAIQQKINVNLGTGTSIKADTNSLYLVFDKTF